jgi:hypothetical protein
VRVVGYPTDGLASMVEEMPGSVTARHYGRLAP